MPQLAGDIFLTNGSIETTRIFREGLELPYFAAFDLLKHDGGCAALGKYFQTHAAMGLDFPHLANALSPLYPKQSEEK